MNTRIRCKSHGKFSFITTFFTLGFSFLIQVANSSETSAWAWRITVEDPEERICGMTSIYLLVEATMSLESLDHSIANGNFNANIAPLHLLLKPGQQDINFETPYTRDEFNQHGIYVLFSDAEPMGSKYYCTGYFSDFREDPFGPPVGYYFDAEDNPVPCYCNISTITLADAKRTGWSHIVIPEPTSGLLFLIGGTMFALRRKR